MSKKREVIPVVAAFDFDGTITDRDSLLPFLLWIFGVFRVTTGLLKNIPSLFGFVIGLISRQQVKEDLLTTFFGNLPSEVLQQYGKQFAGEKLDQYVKKEAIQRLYWHQEQGHHCVLISASIETYLQPWGKNKGFHTIIASQVEISSEGRITGKLRGTNCWGAEKVRRLEECLGPKESYILYAYGDSEGDRALLSIADYAYHRAMPS